MKITLFSHNFLKYCENYLNFSQRQHAWQSNISPPFMTNSWYILVCQLFPSQFTQACTFELRKYFTFIVSSIYEAVYIFGIFKFPFGIFKFPNCFVYLVYLHIQSNLPIRSPLLKRLPLSCHVIENFIWNEPLLRDHLSYKATFSLSQKWPLNTGLTVHVFNIEILQLRIKSISWLLNYNTYKKIIKLNGIYFKIPSSSKI